MQYDEIDLRVRTTDGSRVVEIDGYHHVRPESKPGEYRRIAVLDLTEEQARDLHAELGGLVEEWDGEADRRQG
jgi:hypothetical protein